MKIRKNIWIVVAIIMLCGVIWWNAPYTLVTIEPEEVLRIDIFDGNTGKTLAISERDDIDYIIENLNNVVVKKDKLSIGYMGYGYRTIIYQKNGKQQNKFIINSNDTIRKDPFFYCAESANIDYQYINKLMN